MPAGLGPRDSEASLAPRGRCWTRFWRSSAKQVYGPGSDRSQAPGQVHKSKGINTGLLDSTSERRSGPKGRQLPIQGWVGLAWASGLRPQALEGAEGWGCRQVAETRGSGCICFTRGSSGILFSKELGHFLSVCQRKALACGQTQGCARPTGAVVRTRLFTPTDGTGGAMILLEQHVSPSPAREPLQSNNARHHHADGAPGCAARVQFQGATSCSRVPPHAGPRTRPRPHTPALAELARTGASAAATLGNSPLPLAPPEPAPAPLGCGDSSLP